MSEDSTLVFRDILQEFVFIRTYSRWLDDEQRRETWGETVSRYCNYMKQAHGGKITDKEIKEVYNAIYSLEVMPSMRAMWSAGKAADSENLALYNCSFVAIENIKDFADILYVLLCGTGVGFSVERKFINSLPVIQPKNSQEPKELIIFEDSKVGWAKGFEKALNCMWNGIEFECDYSKIRLRGARLKTSGGRASGPDPLKDLIDFTSEIIEQNRDYRLQAIDVHDICCKIADAVVVGGVRRSALLSLSDLTDNQMALAKTGEFWNIHPQRQMSNNSVAYTRKPDVISFMNEWKNLIKSNSGERGIFNRVAAQKKASENNRRDGSTIVGINPCFVGETVVAVADGRNGIDIEQLAKESNGEIKFPVYCAKEITFNNQFRKTNNFSHWKTEIKNAVAFKSGTKEIIEVLLSDGSIFKCTPNHLIATKDGRWVEAQYCEGEILSKFYTTSNKNSQKNYRTINSITNAYNRQYRMIWEFNNGVYDGKVFNVDHVDEKANNDSLNNLRLISVGEHTTKSQNSKMGNNNPIFRMDADYRRWINRKRNINANAMKHDWPEDQRQAAMEKFLKDNPKPEIEDKNVYLNEQITVEEIIWSGETVDVYDLKVEDNSNFYIITKTDDENFMNCSGVLVHNCAEILLRNRELCNLTEVVVRPEDDFTSLKRKIKVATMMGTWQAAFTNFKFVSKKWKQNCDEEALLGVSLSGLRDHKILGCANDEAKKWLGDLKHIAIATNKKIAERIGINRAAAITCVKPSGTVSVLVDCSPGAHVRQTSTGYYVRRVRISATDPLYLMLKDQGIKMPSETGQTPESASTFVLEFPSKAPDGARTRAGQTAEEQLEYWKMLREFYTEHNPSITISVMESEWLDTAAWVYKHFDNIGGLSFLPTSDYVYQLAPYEDIDKDTYERMVTEMKKVDFSKLSEYEKFDQTVGSKEYACSGGSCELR